jgi:hypothetical protein
LNQEGGFIERERKRFSVSIYTANIDSLKAYSSQTMARKKYLAGREKFRVANRKPYISEGIRKYSATLYFFLHHPVIHIVFFTSSLWFDRLELVKNWLVKKQ